MRVELAGADHGYARCSLPPLAAKFHSASVGRNPSSQMQNAIASYQLTQFCGLFSLSPAASVHVWYFGSHLTLDRSVAISLDSFVFQVLSQPLFGSLGCAPVASAGAFACVPPPALT